MTSDESGVSEAELENIAQSVHKTWMEGRLKEGWAFGSERSDLLKQTPCLVPYSELSETEKEYDRITSRTVIKALLENGFKITKIEDKYGK